MSKEKNIFSLNRIISLANNVKKDINESGAFTEEEVLMFNNTLKDLEEINQQEKTE